MVIADLDASLASWLGELLTEVDVSFDPPEQGEDEPCLWLYLHQVREEPDGGLAGWGTLRNDDGVVSGRVPPTRRYRFTYLMTAQASGAIAEHAILGDVLAGTAMHEVVPAAHLQGSLKHAEQALIVRCAPETVLADGRDLRDLWSAWGSVPRTVLVLSVLAPLSLDLIQEVAAPPSRVELGSRRTNGAAGAPGTAAPDPPETRRPAHAIREE